MILLIVPKDKQGSAITLTQTVLVGGKIEKTATRVTKSGEEITVSIKGVPIIIEGKQIGILAIYEDVSLQESIKQELNRATVEAENIAQAKSEFLSNMSHEIRTPLNAIVGMTGLLIDTELDGEQNDYVQTIRNGSDTLLSIINDILDFSKIDAGKLELETHPFHVRECIESALDLLGSKAAEKGLELVYMIADDVPPVVFGDITRLRQVLVNLIGNAVKFTESGEIIVHAKLHSRNNENCELFF